MSWAEVSGLKIELGQGQGEGGGRGKLRLAGAVSEKDRVSEQDLNGLEKQGIFC